jgi:hypothetical protein
MTMKKQLIAVVLVLSMLSAFAGTAAAAPLAVGVVNLVEVDFVWGKGPVFTFSVSGDVSKSDLKGSLHVEGGGDYVIHCVKVDAETVKCTGPQKVANVNAVVTWGGSTFWTYVPGPRTNFCYDVYDWNYPGPYTTWVNFGSYCQEEPANYGDMIIWYNPGWDDTFLYIFEPESLPCFDEDVIGDAYYYPGCPLN